MLSHGGHSEPGMHGPFPDRYGWCGQAGVGEATSGDSAKFGGAVAFRKDGATAIWAKKVSDLESAIGFARVDLRLALQPDLVLLPTHTPLNSASASALACLAVTQVIAARLACRYRLQLPALAFCDSFHVRLQNCVGHAIIFPLGNQVWVARVSRWHVGAFLCQRDRREDFSMPNSILARADEVIE
jgi:hypothetical protein